MTPEEVGTRLAAAVGEGASASVSGGGDWARGTVDVPVERWRDAVRAARDRLGCDYFDWLSAVDELDDGFRVVVHLWSTVQKHSVLVRTLVPRATPAVPSIVDIFPGAGWPERETHEMFGVDFPGHPDLKPLLLPPEFEGHPWRKDFVLASRVAKDWPGAKEPGESHDPTAARRQKMRPPGVPDPNEWGPLAGQVPVEPAARPARRAVPPREGADRPRRAVPGRTAEAPAPAAEPGPAPTPPGEEG